QQAPTTRVPDHSPQPGTRSSKAAARSSGRVPRRAALRWFASHAANDRSATTAATPAPASRATRPVCVGSPPCSSTNAASSSRRASQRAYGLPNRTPVPGVAFVLVLVVVIVIVLLRFHVSTRGRAPTAPLAGVEVVCAGTAQDAPPHDGLPDAQ